MRTEHFNTVELCRTFDAEAVNAVINAPEVRPFVGDGPEILDIAPLLAKPENVALFGEYGGFMLIWSAPGSYEVHTFITKEGRGKWAREAARQTIAYASRCLGAHQLWTKIHIKQDNVHAFAFEMGMRPAGMHIDGYGFFEMELP